MINAPFDKPDILGDTLKIVRDITADWDTGFAGPLGPETRLATDLGCTSLDCVHLVVALEEHFQRPNLPFQDLFVRVDGRYAEELRISELVAFLFDHVNGDSARAGTGGD